MAPFSHLSDELLSAYADGETTEPERAAARQHLSVCSSCEARVSAFRSVDQELASPATLSCDATRPLLSAELDGELEPQLAAMARAHLASCADCRADRMAWRGLEQRLAALPLASPSRAVDEAIAGLTRGPAPLALPRLVPGMALRIAASVALVMALVSGSVLLPQGQQYALRGEQVVVAAMQTAVFNPRTNLLYVLRPDAALVTVREAPSETLVAEIQLSGTPSALALNPATDGLYVLDSARRMVTEIDAQHRVVGTVALTGDATPTSLQVDAQGKLVVSASEAGSGGKLTFIDPASRSVDSERSVDVAANLVVVDAVAEKTFLLGADATAVLDSRTYARLATLPAAVGAASDGHGVTALLTPRGGDARLIYHGANVAAVDVRGKPLGISAGPDGSFALLLEVNGKIRFSLVQRSGQVDAQDVGVDARQISYDPRYERFTLLDGAGNSVASVSSLLTFTPTASEPPKASTSPSASPSATPSASPDPTASAAQSAPPTAGPSPAPAALALPFGARELHSGTYYLELSGRRQPLRAIARGDSVWFVDQQGGVQVLDARSGLGGRIAQLPGNATITHLALGGSTLYAVDARNDQLQLVDLVSGKVRSAQMPFARSVTGLSVAANGSVWAAVSVMGGLVEFDAAASSFTFVNLRAQRLVGGIADRAGRVWYAHAGSADRPILGWYDVATRRTVEYALVGAGAIQRLAVDGAGSVWVATSSGIWLAARDGQLDGTRVSPAGEVLELVAAPDGGIWVLQQSGTATGFGPLSAAPFTALPSAVGNATFDGHGRAWLPDAQNGGFYIILSDRATSP